MEISRRTVLRTGLAAGAVSAMGLPALTSPAIALPPPLAPQGTTLEKTLVKGAPGVGGYAKVVLGAGEPHTTRMDFVSNPNPNRGDNRSTVLAFAQLSDVHVVDAQSPMRVEYLDRFEDQDQPGDPAIGLLTSSYRPQEMLSVQVADAMVRQINSIGVGPVSGAPLALAIQTGDNADNAQYNETRWNIDVLDGGTVRPDSGDLTKWEGVSDTYALNYDIHYWHPHGRPGILRPFDTPIKKYGFPVIPNLLNRARAAFTAQGLNMPWYTAFGNHDGLVQGNFPPGSMGLAMNAVAMGRLKLISPPPGTSQADLLGTIRSGDLVGLLQSLSPSYVRKVSPDQKRRILRRHEVVSEHFITSGTPVGHGFTEHNVINKTAYYWFDQGNVRFVVLDTVNPNGYADGSLDKPQFDQLASLLTQSRHKYVIIASHHTSETMGNPLIVTGIDLKPRVLGPAVVDLLLNFPNVIAWVNGHSHRNKVWSRQAAGRPGRFWEINTAAHIDFPQQSRLVEVLNNNDGTLSIFCTMVDHAGPANYGGNIANSVSLAGLSRELCANDWHDHASGTGTEQDRNVELLIQTPVLV